MAIVKTNTFEVISQDGRKFTVNEYRKEIDVGHMRNPHKKVLAKLAELRTAEGYAVNEPAETTSR